MQFTKTNNIYKIIRITGSQDNILGISFAENPVKIDEIELIEWHNARRGSAGSGILASKQEVLKQVLVGLELVNNSFETNYKISKIYFSPDDPIENRVYAFLTAKLIRHYHNGYEFKELENGLK